MRGLYRGLCGIALLALAPVAQAQDQGVENGLGIESLTPEEPVRSQNSEQETTDSETFQTLDDQTIDGVKTKSELLPKYSGTSIYKDSRPVGRLIVRARLPGNMSSFDSLKHLPCTAFLIDDDVALTAWHCAPGLVKDARDAGYLYESAVLEFGYYGSGSTDSYDVAYVIEQSEELDYALLKLAPKGSKTPGELYGVYGLAFAPDAAEVPLRLFHHPYGYYKMVLKDGTCQTVESRPTTPYHRLLHHCDTRGGSSGAPILIYDYGAYEGDGKSDIPLAVAINVRGREYGLSSPDQYNQGTRISAIADKSPYLTSMLCVQEPGYGYECPRRRQKFTINFDFDRSDLTPQSAAKLDEIVRLLVENPQASIIIEGHTDGLYGSAYAQALSGRINSTIELYIEGKGIESGRISHSAFGNSRPLVQGSQGEKEPLNRRAELFIDWYGAGEGTGE